MSDFISRNKPDWDELKVLVEKARKWRRRMTPEELSRIDVLYRRTSIHLSQVTTRTTNLQLIQYLNDLTAAAHSLIYLPPRQSIWAGVFDFFADGFPRSIASKWRFHLTSALLLLSGGFLAFFASMSDPLAAYALMTPGDSRLPGSTKEQLLEVLRSGRDISGGGKFAFASFLFSHNLKVGLLAMALGLLAAVPTAILMFYNGMLLGTFVAIHHKAGIDLELWAWLLPHGITELGAIILCGGIGLMMGNAAISPGLLTRSESLKKAGIESGKMCIGVAAMLIVAAIVESYLRQSDLSSAARLTFAGVTAVFWAAYIFHGFIRERAAVRSDDCEGQES